MGILSGLKGGGLRSPKSVKHKGKTVAGIIEAHQRFVRGDESGVRADLAGADLSRVDFEGMNLDLVNFQGANLEGAKLYNVRLSSADLSKANLRKADLRKADLTEAHLSGADLTEAQVGGAELFRTDLRQAILRRANFGAANFRSAEIRGADFTGADLQTTILRETNLEGVDLSGLDLSTTLITAGLPGGGWLQEVTAIVELLYRRQRPHEIFFVWYGCGILSPRKFERPDAELTAEGTETSKRINTAETQSTQRKKVATLASLMRAEIVLR